MGFKVKDHYFKKAKNNNYLARSIYKLEEIDQKYNIINSGDNIVDFGYYPGSWIQYTSQKVGKLGTVTGLDIKEVNNKLQSIENVLLYSLDIFEVDNLDSIGAKDKFDVVLSDMAPNTTGIRSVDQDRSLNLVEKVFLILPIFLKNGGNIVIKVFDSHQLQVFLKEQRKEFVNFHFLKPKSTRSVSKEFFVIGKKYKNNT
ncbi:MAG: RlmE family RNA methyltransferase [Bacteriovoracaceae bacterium]|nr:RlmE family RNA methyltransferase [Bacteriovoracaceae bacterium]